MVSDREGSFMLNIMFLIVTLAPLIGFYITGEIAKKEAEDNGEVVTAVLQDKHIIETKGKTETTYYAGGNGIIMPIIENESPKKRYRLTLIARGKIHHINVSEDIYYNSYVNDNINVKLYKDRVYLIDN